MSREVVIHRTGKVGGHQAMKEPEWKAKSLLFTFDVEGLLKGFEHTWSNRDSRTFNFQVKLQRLGRERQEAGRYHKHSACINLFNPHNSAIKKMLIFQFYRWEKQGTNLLFLYPRKYFKNGSLWFTMGKWPPIAIFLHQKYGVYFGIWILPHCNATSFE